jgi:hypothetical protein
VRLAEIKEQHEMGNEDRDNLLANVTLYGGIAGIATFAVYVSSWAGLEVLFGIWSWLIWGGGAGTAVLLWVRLCHWWRPPRSLRARARIGRVKRGGTNAV